MTETQAKSGASGASTDADDPSVEAPATASKAAPESSAPEKAPGSPAPASPAPASPAPASPAHGSPAAGGDSPGTTPVVKGQTPVPPVVTSVSPRPTRVVDPGRPGGDARADGPAKETVRGTSTVPVVGVAASRTGSAKVGPVTGTAPVVSSAGVASPVIARASVTPAPAGPMTTVTGTGLRQTSGATSFVPTVATPTRPAPTPGTKATEARPAGRASGSTNRGPRRARLHLKRIDPWSVMKFSFAVSLVLFVVAIVATAVLYLALDAMHVWDALNSALSEVTGQAGTPNDSFRVTAKGVIGTAVLLGAVNMVLFTALMTLGAFVYNVCADLVGGIELTLSEKE